MDQEPTSLHENPEPDPQDPRPASGDAGPLPDAYSDVILAMLEDGLTEVEVAQALGVPKRQVRHRLYLRDDSPRPHSRLCCEPEALALLGAGVTPDQVARRLSISTYTARYLAREAGLSTEPVFVLPLAGPVLQRARRSRRGGAGPASAPGGLWRSPPRRRGPHPHPRRDEALEALRTGQSLDSVAQRCEVAAGTLRRWAWKAGLTLPTVLGGRRRRGFDDPLRSQALAALGEGRGMADVAMELPVPLTRLRRWARQAGLGPGAMDGRGRSGVHPLRSAAMLELRQGHSATWVGRALGLHPQKVRTWSHEEGMLLRRGQLMTVAGQRKSPRVAEVIAALGAGLAPAQVAARFGLCVPTANAIATHYLGRATLSGMEPATLH